MDLTKLRETLKPGCHAHLVGIGGVSMAPLAEVLDRGEQNLYACARNIACAIKLGQQIPV